MNLRQLKQTSSAYKYIKTYLQYNVNEPQDHEQEVADDDPDTGDEDLQVNILIIITY